MRQNDTIYNHARAKATAATTTATAEAMDAPVVSDFAQPAMMDFESLGEALVRTDSAMYRTAVNDRQAASAEAVAIYGPLSESVPARHHDRSAVNSPFTASIGFQSCVLLLLISYVLLIFRYRSDIIQLFTNRKSLADELQTSSKGSIYARFFSTTVGVGMLLGAIMIVKGADLAPMLYGGQLPTWLYSLAVPSVLLSAMVVALLQIALLWLIGRVAMCDYVTSSLLRLRKIFFTLFTICCAPSVLLYSLSEIDHFEWLLYLIVAEVVVFLLAFLCETFVLFVSKKISVLHWFLYLCTVELFPVSLIVLTAMREF